jgi:hypothetical protein
MVGRIEIRRNGADHLVAEIVEQIILDDVTDSDDPNTGLVQAALYILA